MSLNFSFQIIIFLRKLLNPSKQRNALKCIASLLCSGLVMILYYYVSYVPENIENIIIRQINAPDTICAENTIRFDLTMAEFNSKTHNFRDSIRCDIITKYNCASNGHISFYRRNNNPERDSILNQIKAKLIAQGNHDVKLDSSICIQSLVRDIVFKYQFNNTVIKDLQEEKLDTSNSLFYESEGICATSINGNYYINCKAFTALYSNCSPSFDIPFKRSYSWVAVFFAPYDISQVYFKYIVKTEGCCHTRFIFNINGAIKDLCYIGKDSCLNNGSYYEFTNVGNCQKEYIFYASLPYLQNIQSMRLFVLGLLVTVFLTLFFKNLFIVFKAFINKDQKELEDIVN